MVAEILPDTRLRLGLLGPAPGYLFRLLHPYRTAHPRSCRVLLIHRGAQLQSSCLVAPCPLPKHPPYRSATRLAVPDLGLAREKAAGLDEVVVRLPQGLRAPGVVCLPRVAVRGQVVQ